MTRDKVVLAYSGGLDTSVAIRWLQDRGMDVVTLTIDVGQPGDLDGIRGQESEDGEGGGMPVAVDHGSPDSSDEHLWGRSVECGVLEDPRIEPAEEVYSWTTSPAAAPDEAAHATIHFDGGKPTALQGRSLEFVDLIASLNELAGRHGVGRIDHVESRVVGIKSREVYECPAATVPVQAHQA